MTIIISNSILNLPKKGFLESSLNLFLSWLKLGNFTNPRVAISNMRIFFKTIFFSTPKIRNFYFCSKIYILENSSTLIPNVTIGFPNSFLKDPWHFQSHRILVNIATKLVDQQTSLKEDLFLKKTREQPFKKSLFWIFESFWSLHTFYSVEELFIKS